MSPEEMLDPRRWWYGIREDELIRGLTALDEVYDNLSRIQQRDMLEMALPGVVDVYDCWADLTPPLRLLAVLDGHLAVSILQDRGEFSGLTMSQADAEDRVRGEWITEIRDVLKRYVTPQVTTGQAALLAVAR